jgi:hypothetical protein
MKSIYEAAGQDLQWKRVKWWKREFELRSGDEVLAKLYRQRGISGVIGEATDGCWNFKRRGFWMREIAITELATQIEIAVTKRGWKTSLTFSDGRVLMFKKTNIWRNEWVWLNDEETPLIRFQRNKYPQIEPAAFSFPELSLLLTLGWHLIVLHQEEAADSGAAVATF